MSDYDKFREDCGNIMDGIMGGIVIVGLLFILMIVVAKLSSCMGIL